MDPIKKYFVEVVILVAFVSGISVSIKALQNMFFTFVVLCKHAIH